MENEDKGESQEQGPLRGKLLSADEVSTWGNESRFIEPGTKTEDGKTVAAPTEDEALTTVDDAIDQSVVADEQEEIAQPVAVENPGEFTPNDYSFDITVFDSEGKNAKTVKIKDSDAWDQLLESDPNLGSAAALAKGLRLAAKMESNIDRDRDAYDKQKADYDSAVAAEAARTQALNTMTAEIDYLAKNGDLPDIDVKYVNADWTDKEIAKQPGVKERTELLTFMRNENNKRNRLGLKPITSVIDAFNAYERQNSKTRQIDSKKLAGQQRKAAGSVVAPASPSQNTTAPKGISVGRGGNLRDLSFNSWS